MKRQYVTGIALWFMCGVLMAQNETDAFRYAQYSPTGTARYTSLGGSMGGFGADFTVLSANNPAGIGLYKRSEIAFTPVLQYTTITSNYNGSSQKYGDYSFRLNNIGFVLSVPVSSKWKYIQFATGYNNLARYDGYSVVKGMNHSDQTGTTNFIDYIAAQVKGISSNEIFMFENDPNYLQSSIQRHMASFAWFHWLIDTVPGTNEYYNTVKDKFEQKQITTTKGYLNEYVFSMGGNYDDKLYIGATIGIPFFKYSQRKTYTEFAQTFLDEVKHYDELKYYDEFQARATGVNFKFGLLYQPFKFMRFGAGIHTPTLYNNVKESYFESFSISSYAIDTIKNGPRVPDHEGSFNYQLITPYRVIGNIAFLFDRYGFLNIDYEYVDYTASQMKSHDYDFATENNNIKHYYQGTHNIRVGTEINLTPVAFRLGYSYTSNPYKKIEGSEVNRDGTTHIIAAGIGFKTRYFFIDFAYRYKMLSNKDMFYVASNLNPYSIDLVNQQFALTLGCKLGK
ncbi:MAG: hypothetical protein LBE13_20175 [Bacteroidales bacterium]|nr:hypothetical protein [Bacteroidales bacterium]